jgi:hypothetical protein
LGSTGEGALKAVWTAHHQLDTGKSASSEDLGDAIVRVHRAGAALRESTASWYARNADELALESSLRAVARGYERQDQRAD